MSYYLFVVVVFNAKAQFSWPLQKKEKVHKVVVETVDCQS